MNTKVLSADDFENWPALQLDLLGRLQSESMQDSIDSVWLLESGDRDAIVYLAALSHLAIDHDVRLGLNWHLVADRPPVLAWKQIVTLDHLCGGRLDLAMEPASVAEVKALSALGLLPAPLQAPCPPIQSIDEVRSLNG